MIIDASGNTSFAGGMTYSGVRELSGSDNLLTTDYFLKIPMAYGAATVTIPTAQCIPGRVFIVKDADGNASSNNISITCEGSQTIDGATTTAVVQTNKGAAQLICFSSTEWFVLGMNDTA